MQEALRYLIEENKYYRANDVHLNQEALQQLQKDGNLMNVRTLHLPECEREASTDQSEPSENQYESHLSTSFIPYATQHRTEQETVEQSLQDLQSGSLRTLIWPTIRGAPISEFTTEGYFSMAFPTLYPTGAADFLGQRCNQVTIGNYFTHLLKYGDGRFARHPRFRFFALNTERGGVHFKREESTSSNIQVTPNLRLMSSETWLVEKDKLSPTGFFIMPQVYMVQDSTCSNREAVSFPWWTHLDYQPFSSPTVQQICSGQNSQVSSALKILTPHPLESKLSMTTLLLQTGSSTTECRSSWKGNSKSIQQKFGRDRLRIGWNLVCK